MTGDSDDEVGCRGTIMGQFLFAGGQSDGCNVKSNGCMNDFTVATWGL